jgi:hypothetical protein
VVLGPVIYGGLGFSHLYAESNISKVETIICHINKGSKLGSTICLNINWLQLHSGISVPILESNLKIDYIQDTWFKEIKSFLNICNVKIKINSLWLPPLARYNDKFIMEELNDNNSSKATRITINNWRMYFNVITISDITNFSGKQIRSVFLDKKEVKGYKSKSKIQCPNQIMPAIDSFHIWVQYTIQITQCSKSGVLCQRLGTNTKSRGRNQSDRICKSMHNRYTETSQEHQYSR